MKNYKSLVTFSLTLALTAFPLFAISTRAQDPQATPLSRGYRTGYSDGYSAGLNDAAKRAPREFRGKPDYQHADRGYNASYGSLDDFRDGYQQGFEAGYNGGFDHRPFDSTAPAGLTRKGAQPDKGTVNNSSDPNANTASNPVNTSSNPSNTSTPSNGPLSIPRDTVMRV